MWSSRPPAPRTVGDILRRPVSGRCALSSSSRGHSENGPTFLTDAAMHPTQRHVLPPPLLPPPSRAPRVQSAPAPRHSCVRPAEAPRRPTAARGVSAQVRAVPRLRVTQRTRRPVDEALFCELRMEGDDTVAAQLRELGPVRLTDDFRSLCSRLSLHHVTAVQFTFLCAAVLNSAVSQRECEVVFAFLRTEQGVGSLDVVDLLSRLRTLFVSPDVLCALQLKRMLETNALSECTVSLDELNKAFAGLQRHLDPGALKDEVDLQWLALHGELSRIHVQYAVLVTTFRVTARRLAPALCAVVQALRWDGAWEGDGGGETTAAAAITAASSSAASAAASGTTAAAPAEVVAPALPPTVPAGASQTALLTAVSDLYHARLAEQDAAALAVASGTFGGPFGAAARRAGRRSTWRASNSAVDVTNPHFVADVYATGRVVCSQE